MQRISEEIIIEGPTTFLQLSKIFVGTFEAGDTTPSVLNVDRFKSPSGATTVTNFVDGAPGQCIRILGNGNLTVSNNTTIKTNTAGSKVLAANKVYTFTLFEEPSGTFVWYEGE